MIGVQFIYILLFSAIQIGAGGYLINARNNLRLKRASKDAILVTAAFLSYNIAELLEITRVYNLIDQTMILLPASLFYYFAVRLKSEVKGANRRKGTTLMLVLSFSVTIAVWLALKEVFGLGITSIVPPMIVLYSSIGFLLTLHYRLPKRERIAWVATGLIIIGFALIIPASLLIRNNGSAGNQLVVNFIYLCIVLEFVTRNYSAIFTSQYRDLQEVATESVVNPSFKYPALDEFRLTKAERETAEGLLDGLSFQELSDLSGRKKNNLYQHAHKVYQKTRTYTLQKFLLTFSNDATVSANSVHSREDTTEN